MLKIFTTIFLCKIFLQFIFKFVNNKIYNTLRHTERLSKEPVEKMIV